MEGRDMGRRNDGRKEGKIVGEGRKEGRDRGGRRVKRKSWSDIGLEWRNKYLISNSQLTSKVISERNN